MTDRDKKRRVYACHTFYIKITTDLVYSVIICNLIFMKLGNARETIPKRESQLHVV